MFPLFLSFLVFPSLQRLFQLWTSFSFCFCSFFHFNFCLKKRKDRHRFTIDETGEKGERRGDRGLGEEGRASEREREREKERACESAGGGRFFALSPPLPPSLSFTFLFFFSLHTRAVFYRATHHKTPWALTRSVTRSFRTRRAREQAVRWLDVPARGEGAMTMMAADWLSLSLALF